MKKHLKFAIPCLSLCLFYALPGSAQSIPAGVGSVPNVGFQIPRLGGSLNYALSASESVSTGFYGSGAAFSTDFDGDLAYLSTSATHPFNVVYAGGVLISNSEQPTTFYQDLTLSQAFRTRKWNFDLQDAFSYLPESPVTGLSGIPGVGDVGIDPVVVGPASGIGVLTGYGPRVSNTVTGSASRIITARFSAQASGYSTVQRFVGDNASEGVNNDSEGGSAGFSYHFDARDTLTASYNYSAFSYPGTVYNYTAQGATLDYSRQWSRRISTDVYAGPQILASSGPDTLPSSTQITAGGGATYNRRNTFYFVDYSRGANNGSGVLPGSFSDNVIGGAHRQYGRVWNTSGSLGWSRTTSLPIFESFTYKSDSVAVSAQVSRAFGRRFSGFASYTIEDQNTSGSAAALNAFHGLYQIFGFGVTYSPSPIALGK